MTALNQPAAPAVARDDRNVRFAWASLVLLPLAVIVPMFLVPAMGVEEQARAPLGVVILMLVMIAALVAVPVLLAWRFANRARSHGDHRGRVPAIIASVVALAFLVLNGASWLTWLLEDTV